MTSRQQLITVIIILAVALAGWTVLKMTLGHEMKPLAVGSRAPSFEAGELANTEKRVTLADYKGDVVMINIWATWCAPCRAEMPSMQKLHENYGDKGLSIVAVSIDDEYSQENIQSFASEYNLTFDILHDPQGNIQRTYQTTGVPETIIVGRDGIIRNKVAGGVDWYSTSNRRLIERLISE